MRLLEWRNSIEIWMLCRSEEEANRMEKRGCLIGEIGLLNWRNEGARMEK